LAHYFDRFDDKRAFTIGYHVAASQHGRPGVPVTSAGWEEAMRR
jgi:hypothetical protein